MSKKSEKCKGCINEDEPATAIPCNDCSRINKYGLDFYQGLTTFSDGKIR